MHNRILDDVKKFTHIYDKKNFKKIIPSVNQKLLKITKINDYSTLSQEDFPKSETKVDKHRAIQCQVTDKGRGLSSSCEWAYYHLLGYDTLHYQKTTYI